ncbi:MAG: DUF3568 family protein [Candidatus Omnitrophica bacterium]|nr:DUF3568 family protein [Candidatus Omnitrophota bacterium]
MQKKLAVFISSLILLTNICGCVALIAGSVAGGAGTAVWLSGKLVQSVDFPLDQTTKAAKDYLQSRKLSLTSKETISSGHSVVQIRSRETNGERVRIDIHKIAETRSRVEVRVGTVISNKEAADRILRGITERL